ncbi:hypothetical protein SFUMM280S_03241 [Streptomyces fumanus]
MRKDPVVAKDRGTRARHRLSARSSEPDEELMRALLYREHADGPLLAYVLRLVAGDRQRAEDVVQETRIPVPGRTPVRSIGRPVRYAPGW